MIDPFERNWKPVTIKPKDDSIILISWKDSEGLYKGPYRAYYVEEEDKFFSVDDIEAFPIQVEIWIEMPKFPNQM